MRVEEGSLWPVTLAVFAIVATTLVLLLWRNYCGSKYFKKNDVPYRRPVPFFGTMLPTLTKEMSYAEFIIDLYEEFPDAKYFGAFEFTNPVYVLRDLELIKSVTVKNFDHFPNHKMFIDESTDPLFGGVLFALTGERWREMRSIISPVFTSSKMRAMFELMSKCAEDFADYLAKQPGPLTLDMKDTFTRYTNDVIATTAFGISVNSMVDKENEFYMMGKDATNFGYFKGIKMLLFSLFPTVMKLLKQTFLSAQVSRFFCGVVRDTISIREKDGIIRPDLIHLLMQARHKESDEKLTISEITSQAFLFFFAGFDSGSTLMCFASHQLAVHPDMQDKLVAEIDAAFKEEDKLSYEKVNHLQYLEMFLNETLRYYPPAVFLDRVNTQEFEFPPANEEGKPVLVKPGDRIWVPVLALHRDPKYFPDPDKFDPERFSPENKGSIDPFAFLPFGAGPRNCPGNRFALLETKLVLCSLLRKFRIRTGAKTHLPLVLKKGPPVMTAEHGFWLDLEPRHTTIS